MTDTNEPSGFTPSFLAAREKADAAADAERAAREALRLKSGSSHGEMQAWLKAHEESRAAQEEFAREVRDWFAQNALD
jgi:hypothetical protein